MPDDSLPRGSLPAPPAGPVPIAAALKRVLSKGYGPADMRADVMAGAVVGIVALPLSMALAIAVGAPPQHGLYTAIVAGFAVALLGGCKFQVTGPTAAFVVVLSPIVSKYGLSGLLTAGLLAGFMLLAMGVARLGSLISYIPYPVTSGFTAGIAAVIATLQVKDVFGLQVGEMPEHFVDKVEALLAARGTAQPFELLTAATTLALLVYLPRINAKLPAPLIAIAAVAAITALLHALLPSFAVATIGSRFQTVIDGRTVAGIPPLLPSPSLPWAPAPLSFAMIRDLLPAAFAIAMLGAIESLLSAVIADGMTNTRHEPNSELVALGIGNILAPIFGGIAATGALARTATNIRAGARSPFAAMVHSLLVLVAMLSLAPLLAYVPMAALAALLLRVAFHMAELRGVAFLLRVAPKSDTVVLVTCFLLTVFFDMVIAVSIGFVMAAVLFIRRMTELTQSRLQFESSEEGTPVALPPGVVLYEINGPLFFGAAQKAMRAFDGQRGSAFRVLIIHLGRVPVIDATGLVALENGIDAVLRGKRKVVLAGPLPSPREIFERAQLTTRYSGLTVAPDLTAAIQVAGELARAE